MSQIFDPASADTPEQAVDFLSQWFQASTEYALVGLGLDGTILLWNEGARRLYGFGPAEMVGRAKAASLQDPADSLQPLLQTALQQGKWVGTLAQRRQNGQLFKARVTLTPAHDSAGRPSGFLLMTQDMAAKSDLAQELLEIRLAEYQRVEATGLSSIDDEKLAYRQAMIYAQELKAEIIERRRVEAALRESENRYRQLIEQSPDPIVIGDLKGNITLVNPALLKLIGCERAEEIIGQSGLEFVVPEDREKAGNNLRQVLETGSLHGLEYTALKKDGTLFLTELSLALIRNLAGEPAAVIGILRDLTERKRAEAALRYQAALVDNVSDAIIATDSLLNITVWNNAAEKIYVWSAAEVLGKPIYEVIPAEFPGTTEEAVTQQLLELGYWHGEMVQRRKDGTPIYTLASTSRLKNDAGELIGAVTINHDLTERKRAEESLRESEARLNLALTASQMGVWEWDISTDAVFWSPQCFKIAGVEHFDDRLDSFVQALHPEDAARVMATANQALAEKKVFTAEFRFILPGGEVRWLSNLGQGVYDEYGNPLRLIGTAHDITERKQIEEDLRRHAARNEALLKIAGALAETGLDVQAALETIARQAVLAIGDACVITRLSDDEQWYETIAFYHADPAVIAAMTPLLTAAPVPVTAEWLQRMISTGQPLFVPVMSSEEARRTISPRHWSYLEQVGVHSLLIVPLQVQGRVIGTLGLSRDRSNRPYTADDRIFLQELADRAALTIQNAHLFEHVEQANEQLQALSLRLLEVQESERRYLARELHDEVGQLLTGLKLKLELSARDTSRTALAEIQTLVNNLMGRVRNLSLDLRPSMLDDLGLLPALLWHFERYTVQTGVEVIFRHSGLEDQRFPPPVETAVYRLVQEALTNVARHAGVKQAQVQVWTGPDMLHLQVKDEGRGFAAETVLAASSSVGLRGMQERVALLGGWLMVESAPGSGACLTVELPLVKDEL